LIFRNNNMYEPSDVAKEAVKYANALIKELKQNVL
jgi:hypothetical protein